MAEVLSESLPSESSEESADERAAEDHNAEDHEQPADAEEDGIPWYEGTVKRQSGPSQKLEIELKRRFFPLQFAAKVEPKEEKPDTNGNPVTKEEDRFEWSDSEPDDDLAK